MNLFSESKLNTKGLGNIETILIVVAVVVLAWAAVLIYQDHHKTNVSHAGSYTMISVSHGVTTYACDSYSPAYGGIYSVTALFTKSASTPSYEYDLEGYRPSNPSYLEPNQLSSSYTNGTSGEVKINISAHYGDEFGAGLTNTGFKWMSPKSLQQCD